MEDKPNQKVEFSSDAEKTLLTSHCVRLTSTELVQDVLTLGLAFTQERPVSVNSEVKNKGGGGRKLC